MKIQINSIAYINEYFEQESDKVELMINFISLWCIKASIFGKGFF